VFSSSSLLAVSSTGGSLQEQQSVYLTEKNRVGKEVTAGKPGLIFRDGVPYWQGS
jgi:hypothetical protein